MTFTQKTLFAFALACTPIMTLAAVPPTITSIEARLSGGVLTVLWAPPKENAEIAFYRVYFSHESIVGNDGNYDDFERTKGSETTYSFTKLPLASQKIFIAVLAVNTAGQESEGFETEASVDSGNTQAGLPTVAQSGAHAGTAMPMSLISVRAVSQTGILLTFTKPPAIGIPFSPDFFLITDGSGAVLETKNVTVSGATVLLSTATQAAERNYLFAILQPIPASDGTNAPTSNAQRAFHGFQSEEAQAATEPESLPYVRNPMLGQATGGLPVLPIDEAPVQSTAKSNGKNGLPDSGVGLFGIVGLAGLLAGRQILKRKEEQILVG